MENQITIVQLPIISHNLKEAAIKVKKRISDLELDKQIATEDTVKTLKSTRAELNKESAALDVYVKETLLPLKTPISDIEKEYKEGIQNEYKIADEILKDAIGTFEFKIKSEKKQSVETYFNELCLSEKIDFITFDKLGIEINLSTTEKKYKEQVNAYITKVVDDLALIKTTDYEAEILTEYKVSLNVSNAITTVKTRKENEAQEQAKLKAEQTQNRKNYLSKLGLNYVEITNSYEFNADIYITLSDINNLSKEDFTKKYAEVEAKIKDFRANISTKENEVSEPVVSGIETRTDVGVNPATGHSRVVVNNPISAPVVQEVKVTEEIVTASFEVTGTRSKLRLLGAWMIENGIEYENI